MVCVASTASAEEPLRPPREHPFDNAKGAWSIGVFNPLKYRVSNRLELETHPIVFIAAPNVVARYTHIGDDTFAFNGEYGLSVPTGGMRFLRNDLWGAKVPLPASFFPLWATSGNNVGWFVVPSVGLSILKRRESGDVMSGRLDGAFGIPLGKNPANPPETFLAPLNLLVAPALNGYRVRLGGAYDKVLSPRWRVRAEANVHYIGRPGEWPIFESRTEVDSLVHLSSIYLTGHVGADVAVFEKSRVVFGVYLANYDQGARVYSKGDDGYAVSERVRSNNILPTIDFIWSGGSR